MTGEAKRRPFLIGRAHLSIGHIWLLAPWVGLAIAAFQPIRDNSFLWHIRAGTIQLDAGEVLRSDPFSFALGGEPWRTQSWLVELLYGKLEGWTNLSFVPYWILSTALVIFVVAGIRLSAVTRDRRAIGLALVALVWMAVGFMVPRPVVVTFALLSLLLLAAKDRRLRWALPLLIWIWAAAHGSFVLGIGYLVLDSLRRNDRELAIQAGFGVVAASFTAHGWHVWETLLDFARNRDALEYIAEWATPSVTDLSTLPFFIGLAGLLVSAMRHRISAKDLWVIVPFVAFGMTSQRALFPAMIVLLPWMVAWRDVESEISTETENPYLVLSAAIVVFLVPFLLVSNAGQLDDARFPVAAAEYLDIGPVFHDDYVGGYLVYAKWPDWKVFVDDRAEFYGAAFFDSIIRTRMGGPEWVETFERWDIEQVLVSADDSLVESLENAGWDYRYSDEAFVVMAR